MSSRRLAGENVPAGTLALVRSPLALRCSKEQSALHTLIRQRHLTPSCGGHAPTAERTMDPARMFKESLTSRPELENSQGQTQTSIRPCAWSALRPSTDIVCVAGHVRKVPQEDIAASSASQSLLPYCSRRPPFLSPSRRSSISRRNCGLLDIP